MIARNLLAGALALNTIGSAVLAAYDRYTLGAFGFDVVFTALVVWALYDLSKRGVK